MAGPKGNSARSVSRTAIAAFAFTCLLAGCAPDPRGTTGKTTSNGTPIQIGWLTSVSATGQIIQALMHTNIADLYESPVCFRAFLFGPESNEAALNGSIDCTTNGIVPTISLLSASADWVVVARTAYSPVSIVAHPSAKIRSVNDLKGKRIAVPFGSATHPYVLQKLSDFGMEVGESKDEVRLINLKPSEHAMALQQGIVDAVGTWEPQTSIIVSRGIGNVVDTERHLGAIVVRKSIAVKEPQKVVNLIKAFVQANYYVSTHRSETDGWFADASGIDHGVVDRITNIEPNAKAKSITEIDIDITAQDLAIAQRFSDTMHKAQLTSSEVALVSRIDRSFLDRAMTELASQGYRTARVTTLK